jgi:hypothetical protein
MMLEVYITRLILTPDPIGNPNFDRIPAVNALYPSSWRMNTALENY